MRRTSAALFLLPILVAGCSAHGGSPSAGAAAAAPDSGFPSTAAQASAQRAVLTIRDLPAGWTASKDTSDDAGPSSATRRLSDCLQIPPGLLGAAGRESRRADSPDFHSQDGAEVTQHVTVSTLDRTTQLFSILEQQDAADCLSTAFNAYMQQMAATSTDPFVRTARIGVVELSRLPVTRYADDTVAFRSSVPVAADGLSLTFYIDAVYVRYENAVTDLTFLGFGTPVTPATADDITERAAQKLTNTSLPAA